MRRLRKTDLLVEELPIRRPKGAQPRFIAVSCEGTPGRIKGNFRTRQVHKQERAPFSSVGLLVGGEDGTATTAWLVAPNAILTAAHPLRARRSFYFGLQYSRTGGGLWTRVVRSATLQGWLEHRDYRCDLAICLLEHPFQAPPLRPEPLPAQLPHECLVIGYSFGTATLWQSHCRDLCWKPQGATVSTDLTEGSSGGPWLVRKGGRYLPVGLTSRGGEGFLTSPSWGQGCLNLLDWLQ